MSRVTVIGAGKMGSALTRALAAHGHEVSVWNRTIAKLQPLAELGVVIAPTLADAVRRSAIVIISVTNYSATRELFEMPEVASIVAGRTFVQMSTGSPRNARDSEAWFRDHGGSYLDGVIMAFADNVGQKDTQVLVSGVPAVFKECRPHLECIGGDLRYLGGDAGAAAVMDLAQHCYYIGGIMGVAAGAALCRAEEVGVDLFASTLSSNALAQAMAQTIHDANFSGSGSTVGLWAGAVDRIRETTDRSGIRGEFFDAMFSVFERAMRAGFSKEDVTALIKLLEARSTTVERSPDSDQKV